MTDHKRIDFATDPDVEDLRKDIEREGSRLRRTARLAGVAVAFFIFATSVMVSLTDQGPFHMYWPRFGLFALLLNGIGLLAAVYRVGLLWASWTIRRDLQNDLR
jgi:hypothetical protein